MPSASGRRKSAAFALTATAALSVIAFSGTAEAQGLFDVLRGIFGGHRPPPVQQVLPPLLLDGFPDGQSDDIPHESGGPEVAYCVRLYDGRYFPLPRNAGAPSMTPQKICSAMCPATETKVFSGTSITRAFANDGKDYSSIENAFLYREQTVDNCSCTGRRNSGVAAMDIRDDPTLRRGDIVVTTEGPKVFTGDNRPPHKPSEFVPADEYKGLPKKVLGELSEIRVAPESKPTLPPLSAGPAAAAPKVTPSDPQHPQTSLSYSPIAATPENPVTSAFASFQN